MTHSGFHWEHAFFLPQPLTESPYLIGRTYILGPHPGPAGKRSIIRIRTITSVITVRRNKVWSSGVNEARYRDINRYVPVPDRNIYQGGKGNMNFRATPRFLGAKFKVHTEQKGTEGWELRTSVQRASNV